MSIETIYYRVTPSIFRGLVADPESAMLALHPAELPDGYLPEATSPIAKVATSEWVFRLGNDWHALHFLLTGDANIQDISGAALPLRNVVLGGTDTPVSATYGQVRALNPDEVRAVAEALRHISVEDLARRFDPDKFTALQIYPNPQPDGWIDLDLEPLLDLYPRLVEFFKAAANAGEMILIGSY